MKVEIKGLGAFLMLCAICVMAAAGCATKLDSTGVYGSQTNGAALYQADLTIATAYDEMDAFVSWEAANHSYLVTNAPQVWHTANTIRSNAPTWISTAVALRNAYQANASVSNANALATSLAVLQTAASQVTNYINTPTK